MSATPHIWELTDDEIVEELSRIGWVYGTLNALPEERAMALSHEALRRILILLSKIVTIFTIGSLVLFFSGILIIILWLS